MPICDLHTHTVYSFDGKAFPKKLCASAEEKGLLGLAITEHYDFFLNNEYIYYDCFAKERNNSFEHLASLYSNRLKIWKGIELGQPHYDIKRYQKVLSREKFDIIIGSIHNTRDGVSIFDRHYNNQKECDQLFEAYFAEMREMCEKCDFDVLGHLDYPIRVMGSCFERDTSLIDYRHMIIPVLELCVQKGIALEINTAGMRKWLGIPGPALWVLKEYKALGGKMITIGSDAHIDRHCAWGFKQAAELAHGAGFSDMVYFEGRKPHFTKFE